MALAIQPHTPQVTPEELAKRFRAASEGRTISDEEKNWAITFEDRIGEIAGRINLQVKDSREKSLALTALEDALMWTKKALFQE